MKLVLLGREATSLDDAEKMRVIRNSCRAWMTRSTAELTPEAQASWWAALDRALVRPYVFEVVIADSVLTVGYGLAREEDNRSWVSGGLLPEWRSMGLGAQLFRFLMQHVRTAPCWLEVREDNPAAQRIYAGLGFIESSKKDGIITMVEKHLL